MNREIDIAQLRAEETASFLGWDFSHLDGRWDDEPLPWDYRKILLSLLKPTHRLLDMGTGGGEFLLGLGHPHGRTAVTEDYPPNLDLCRARLTPLSVDVRQTLENGLLPFEDGTFDLVANRHEDFDAREVYRVLKPGGFFVTQQVGGKNNRDLSERLIQGYVPLFPDHDLAHNAALLERAGFAVMRREECFPTLRFYDLGAVVYFAKIISWEFPGFTVATCLERLRPLQDELTRTGAILSTEHRFLLVAQKLP